MLIFLCKTKSDCGRREEEKYNNEHSQLKDNKVNLETGIAFTILGIISCLSRTLALLVCLFVYTVHTVARTNRINISKDCIFNYE